MPVKARESRLPSAIVSDGTRGTERLLRPRTLENSGSCGTRGCYGRPLRRTVQTGGLLRSSAAGGALPPQEPTVSILPGGRYVRLRARLKLFARLPRIPSGTVPSTNLPSLRFDLRTVLLRKYTRRFCLTRRADSNCTEPRATRSAKEPSDGKHRGQSGHNPDRSNLNRRILLNCSWTILPDPFWKNASPRLTGSRACGTLKSCWRLPGRTVFEGDRRTGFFCRRQRGSPPGCGR